VLGALGAGGGTLLTLWALDALPLFLPPGYAGFSMNPMVLLFSTAVSMTGVLAAGLLPALKGAQRDPAQTIKGGSVHRGRLLKRVGIRQILVSVEVAMALVLLVSAGLLLESFAGLASVDVGFPRQDLLTLRLELPEEGYGEEESRLAFLDQLGHELEDRIPRELADITLATGLVEGLSASMAPLAREGSEEGQGTPGFLLVWAVATDYFEVVGVPIDQGRAFQDTDGPESESVIIINREVARRYFPEGQAVGQYLRLRESPYRVVGVAGSVNLPSMAQSPLGDQQLFFPLKQRPPSNPTVVARIRGDASAAVARLKEAVWAVDPTLPAQEIALVEDALAESLTQERSNAILMVLFAVTALVLGAVGIYGVVAYSVGRQMREIGIRVSLGATQGREVARVVRAGMGTVGMGLVLGGLGIAAVTTPLSGLLYQVDTRDPWVLTQGVLLVGGVALLATWLPARRATGSAPVQALKEE
jgi:predicted permease